jgi:hypothetical protein
MEKIIGKADFVYLTSAGRGRSGVHAKGVWKFKKNFFTQRKNL